MGREESEGPQRGASEPEVRGGLFLSLALGGRGSSADLGDPGKGRPS